MIIKCIAREALCPKVAPLHKNNIQQDTKCDFFFSRVLCLYAEMPQRMRLLCLFISAYQGGINESGAGVELAVGRAAGAACGTQQTPESRSD